MLTEKEASAKWCPFARVTGYSYDGGPTSTGNREVMSSPLDAMNSGARCIASDCMAWRFKQKTYERETELWSRSKNSKVNSAWGDDAWWKPIGADADEDPPEAVGFCGLAVTKA